MKEDGGGRGSVEGGGFKIEGEVFVFVRRESAKELDGIVVWDGERGRTGGVGIDMRLDALS